MFDLNMTALTNFVSGLSIAEGQAVLWPLIIFVVGMVVYSVFVFKFYKFIAKKNIFELKDGRNSSVSKKIFYALKYIFLFPIAAFLWFFVIAVLLSVLSHVLAIGDIFMISMAVMTTIRLTAYYSEDLSRDIAKLIPFAMLAVFLLDISSITLSAPLDVIRQIPSVASTLVYYFVFIVVLEFILKVVSHVFSYSKREVKGKTK